MRCIFACALLALAACSGGGNPTPPVGPAPPPRPGMVFTGDFTGPSIGLGLACTQDAPPVCTGTSLWRTFDRPGSQGDDVVDPGPNPYYTANGRLNFNAPAPGWPMMTAATFPKDKGLSVECTITVVLTNAVGFAGCGIYNGELNYTMLYVDGAGFTIYRPTITIPIGAAPGGAHRFRIDSDGKGTLTYFVDDVLRQSEPPNSIGPDSTWFFDDPHLAMFWGYAYGVLSSASMAVGP